ncbi:glycosyltransferase family protein [Acinetobacter indicus]|uniref:hypothetical protein n=1 Tax=Acinetobacter indicus TaxID=756892 RepID=UPI002576D15E|nr:hypothetical protein [Acinetobacter indicus]MDM1772053.1 hypothetical protein [Acinetobacter indicus]MDM1774930.1 hypothetical protein [Acinetobacter indicus]
MFKLKIIAPLPSITKRTRLTKIVECLDSSVQVSFFGWKRDDAEIIDDNSNIILNGGGYSSRKARLMYLLWFIKVFFVALKFNKFDKVWALGFESAFPCVLASKIKGFQVIYDDADRFSSLFNFPSFIHKILVKLEVYTSLNCFKHIIPGVERYEFDSPNFFILKNTPTSEDILKAKSLTLDPKIVDKLKQFKKVIYVNGWLGEGRGLKIIYEVAKKMPQIGILMAGRIDSKYAQEMLDFENVIYIGEVPQYEALAYYQVCDFIFTYYDPIVPINRMAEANKWGDALQFAVPVIVNKEVITAEYLRNSSISVPYNNVDDLINEIINHINDEKKYVSLVESIVNLEKKFPTFDKQVTEIFSYF